MRLPSGGVAFDWAAVSATVVVNNSFSVVTARVQDYSAAGNKLNVYLIGEGLPPTMPPVATFYTQPGDHNYTLFSAKGRASFSGLTATLRLEKAVEARFTQGNVTVVSFSSDAPFLPPPMPSARRLEILGDSITSGDLVLCSDRLGSHVGLPNGLWADNAGAAYHSLLCAALGADCSVVSWGGMGLVWNDVPSWTWPTLPQVYGSALGWQAQLDGPGHSLSAPWNFSAFIPSAVLINLGTNDAWALRNASSQDRWAKAMAGFVTSIAGTYAAASGAAPPHFFLAFGPMSTAYLPPLLSAIEALRAGTSIAVTLLDMTLNKTLDCGHPSAADHALMARKVLANISTAMGWQ